MKRTLLKSRTQGEVFIQKAIKELIQLLKSLKDFHFDPAHNISFRVKSVNAINEKIMKNSQSSSHFMNDFMGIRLLVYNLGEIEKINNVLASWSDNLGLVLINCDNKFDNPDSNGYRGIHFDYRFRRPEDSQLPSEAGIELQITTWLQHLHSVISYDLYYKKSNVNNELVNILRHLSSDLHELDKEIAEIIIDIQ